VSHDGVTGRTSVTSTRSDGSKVTTIQSDGDSRQAATGGGFLGLF